MNAGTFIQSTPLLDGSIFEKTLIYLTEYNAKGAAGFIVNRPFNGRLNQLEEFKTSPPFPLYDGGPVDGEHLFFIHRRPGLIEGGTPVSDSIFVGGNFKQAIQHINNRTINTKHIKLFIGYCGWGNGELESEIAEGSWVVAKDGAVF